jgi:uncharacterized membrane protein YgcG
MVKFRQMLVCLLMGLGLLLLLPLGAQAGAGDYDVDLGERILDYHSEIVIQQDSTMTVTETILVQALGNQIQHGIYRDFPTRYADQLGRSRTVGFEVLSVKRDGQPEPYHLNARSNGIRLYVGHADRTLAWGTYKYEIEYATNRQLGFFDDHDELYWNVTGTGWDFAIDRASARVTLPVALSGPDAGLEAYTGYSGEQGQLYQAGIDETGRAVFNTTTTLFPRQGLTIVVMFAKGIVNEPTRRQLLGFWIADHRAEVWGAVGLAVILLYYLLAWILVGVDPQGMPVPPQDSAPQGLSAAMLRYIQRMGSDFTTFTAALTSMAIKHYLRIETDAAGSHTIVRDQGSEEALTEEERELGRAIFSGGNQLLIDQDNHTTISSAKNAMDSVLGAQCQGRYFFSNHGAVALGVLLTIGCFVLIAVNLLDWMVLAFCSAFTCVLVYAGIRALRSVFIGWGLTVSRGLPAGRILSGIVAPFLLGLALIPAAIIVYVYSLELALVVLGLALVNALFIPLLPRYTREGRNILDQSASFRSSLAGLGISLPGYREQGALGAMSFLPYAIALDIHRQWARQLEEIFAVQGQPPRPYWYQDPYNENLRYERLTSDLAGSFTSSISSASVAPGSSSGGGGGGSSGGGGGGGGGGGW